VNYDDIDDVDCMVAKMSSDQPVPINKECEDLVKYSIFNMLTKVQPKTYRLVLRGSFFGHRLKVGLLLTI
jgi:hypothetical protein